MAEDRTMESFALVVAILALGGIVFVAVSFAVQRSVWGMMGGGGMHDGQVPADGPGVLEWGALAASLALFAASVAILWRGRAAGTQPMPPPPIEHPAAAPSPPPNATSPPAVEPISELTLVKLLGEDERRMYLEIRERGGEVLQRDLVALGTFSKAKVTRVLDKLESKGLIVRERSGMTNRVRIVDHSSRKAAPDRVVSDS